MAVGLAGFIPALSAHPDHDKLVVDAGYGLLLGLFPINILHNFVHLVIGLTGLASYRSFSTARLYARGLAIAYVLLAIMGLFPVLRTTFGLIPIFGHDIWLHAASGLLAGYVGFLLNESEAPASMTSTARA